MFFDSAKRRDLLFACYRKLLRIVFHCLHWMTKDLLQTPGSRTVGLTEVFVDFIAVAHAWSGISDQFPANHTDVAAMKWIAKHTFHRMGMHS